MAVWTTRSVGGGLGPGAIGGMSSGALEVVAVVYCS